MSIIVSCHSFSKTTKKIGKHYLKETTNANLWPNYQNKKQELVYQKMQDLSTYATIPYVSLTSAALNNNQLIHNTRLIMQFKAAE